MAFSLGLQDWGAILLATGVFLYLKNNRRRSNYPLPPSPKGRLPVLGHALQFPTNHGWTTFERWGNELNSDIIYLDAAGADVMVVNSYQIIRDLFDSRSSIYSGRSTFPMVNELMGYDWTMPTLQYNSKWKAQRRIFSKFFSASNPSAYQPRITEFVGLLLPKLLDNPEDFIAHIKHMVGATVTSLAYGIKVQPTNDPNLRLAQDSLDSVLEAFIPGKYLVDQIPALKHLPEWLPGTGFLQDAKRGRETMVRLLELPFADAERQIANGTARPALVSMVLDDVREMTDPEEIEYTVRQCKELAAVFFGAGYDTTHATIINFFLAMVHHPEVQAKARSEIDRVVGFDRLPAFSDEEHLPYLRAVMKEVLRWRPVSAIGLPHMSSQEDVYDGYFIPENTLIIPNQRGMLFDPETYPNPTEFKPERFLSADGKSLNPAVRDPQTIAFGFGRRMCPGFHIATAELFLAAASILATFELSKAKDEAGNIIEPSLDVSAGITSHPLPFKCVIKPCSKKAEVLIYTNATQYDA
ncbi:cytochrome P450 [Coprinellus micaceus]|uniref:Cytochrome P450 n=1 Tax=Coprinellus micaceus TaxID=71717 RepID=A0A4Y7TGL3_COPMI|nr:cytochrome P450 [Coprinellus micaceus]